MAGGESWWRRKEIGGSDQKEELKSEAKGKGKNKAKDNDDSDAESSADEAAGKEFGRGAHKSKKQKS